LSLLAAAQVLARTNPVMGVAAQVVYCKVLVMQLLRALQLLLL
jgi:hypothetical protein